MAAAIYPATASVLPVAEKYTTRVLPVPAPPLTASPPGALVGSVVDSAVGSAVGSEVGSEVGSAVGSGVPVTVTVSVPQAARAKIITRASSNAVSFFMVIPP